MADAVYPKFKEKLGKALVDLEGDDIRVMYVGSGYAYDAGHEYLADVAAYDNGRSGALQNKSIALGLFDADDIIFALTAAIPVNAVVLYVHTGNDATAILICYLDEAAFTPAAGQYIEKQFNPSGIFQI